MTAPAMSRAPARFLWRAALAALLFAAPFLTLRAGADPRNAIPGEALVGFRNIATLQTALTQERFGDVGVTLGVQPSIGAARIRLRPGLSLEAALTRLRRRPDVRYAEPNYRRIAFATPNDPGYTNQYSLQKTQADLAWSLWQPQTQVIIAILDTGVSGSHPDLTNKMLRDGAGIIGYDSFTNARSAASDGHGHGTHCAGIAAAQINNGTGIAGVAGWNGAAGSTETSFVKLMPVKVLDSSGNGSDASVANGILWAADHGAKVLSMSLGGQEPSQTVEDAIAYALGMGCVVVAAAGNYSSSTKVYPAACPGVISVASTGSSDTLSSFSSYGSWVTTAAPGSNIYSTWLNNGYATLSGTSMACPLVAGEAALLLAQNPALTNTQARAIILAQVDAYTPYSGRTIGPGAGRVNVNRTLQAAETIAPSVPTALIVKNDQMQDFAGTIGQYLYLKANLRRTDTNAGLSAQTLTFKIDGTPVGQATTFSSGSAWLGWRIPESLGAGAHTITVTFGGDTTLQPTNGTGALTVSKAPVNILVRDNSLGTHTAQVGQYLYLRAEIRRAPDGRTLGGKTLVFTLDGAAVGSGVTTSGGVAWIGYRVPESLGVGTHTIGVSFAGDSLHLSGSGTGALEVTQAPVTLAVSHRGQPFSGSRGQNVYLEAILRRAPDARVLGGRTVTFKVDGQAVGQAVTFASGTALLLYAVPAGMSVGAHQVTAEFAGDANHLPGSQNGTLNVN